MNKRLLAISIMFTFGFYQAHCLQKTESKDIKKKKKFACVDSVRIFTETKEGKILKNEIQSKIDEYQGFVKEAQEKLVSLEKEIKDKENILSEEKLKEKKEVLEREKQKLGTEVSQRQYVLNADFQRKQESLRDQHLNLIKEIAEKEDVNTIFDKNSILFSKEDITEKVIEIIDTKYEDKVLKMKNKTSKNEKTSLIKA